jgi:hypothetical protein
LRDGLSIVSRKRLAIQARTSAEAVLTWLAERGLEQ